MAKNNMNQKKKKNKIKNKYMSKKKRSGSSSMEIEEEGVCNLPQAMDTSESGTQNLASGPHNLKVKKGRQMKRSKNVRKMKARAKGIASNDKIVEKVSKNESKTKRVQLGKTLYE